MLKLFLMNLSFFFSVLFVNYSLADSKKDNIIYFCENKFGYPWHDNASSDCTNNFLGAVFGTLISINHIGEMDSELLESFEWDYNYKYYKLKLKDNLYFQNGRKITIEDLEFSILRHRFAKKVSKGSLMFFNLKGIEKIRYGQPYKSGIVEGIKILDQKTLALIPSYFTPLFLNHLSRPQFSLVPQEELNNDLLTWKKWPIGAGAYKVTGEDKIKRIIFLNLFRNLEYPKAPKSIHFVLERNNEPDISLRDDLHLSNKVEYKQEKLFLGSYRRVIDFNHNSKLGRNEEFRKAISLAVSREDLAKEVNASAVPVYEMIEVGGLGRINVKDSKNRDEASRLFKKVLGSQRGKIFKIPYSPDSLYFGNKYKDILKYQFAQVGLNVDFYEMNGNLFDFFSNEFKEAPFNLVTIGGDCLNSLFLFILFSKNLGLTNHSCKEDMSIHNLIEEAKLATNKKVLNEKLIKLSQYFFDHKIIVPLFESPMTVFYNSQKITSIGSQFGGAVFYLHNLEVNRDIYPNL